MLLLNEFPHREWLCPSTRTYKYSIFAKELNKPLQLVHHKKMPIWGDAGATSVLHTRLWRTLRSCPLCFRGCGGFYLSLYVTFTCRGNQVWTFSARLMISDWLTAPVCHVWSNQAKKNEWSKKIKKILYEGHHLPTKALALYAICQHFSLNTIFINPASPCSHLLVQRVSPVEIENSSLMQD